MMQRVLQFCSHGPCERERGEEKKNMNEKTDLLICC